MPAIANTLEMLTDLAAFFSSAADKCAHLLAGRMFINIAMITHDRQGVGISLDAVPDDSPPTGMVDQRKLGKEPHQSVFNSFLHRIWQGALGNFVPAPLIDVSIIHNIGNQRIPVALVRLAFRFHGTLGLLPFACSWCRSRNLCFACVSIASKRILERISLLPG